MVSHLWWLLLLIYNNDLNHAIKFCKAHHFADDTNLVHFSKSVNKLNKDINIDMKNLTKDCQQITFVTLNRFCPLSKSHPPALNGQN